jgi:hypothetical protein
MSKTRRKRMWAVRDGYGNVIAISPDRTRTWAFAAEAQGYFGRTEYILAMERDGYKMSAVYISNRNRSEK